MANVQVHALRFCLLLFDNEAVTSKSATIKTCCVKTIHAVNALLWHPGEQAQKLQINGLLYPLAAARPRVTS